MLHLLCAFLYSGKSVGPVTVVQSQIDAEGGSEWGSLEPARLFKVLCVIRTPASCLHRKHCAAELFFQTYIQLHVVRIQYGGYKKQVVVPKW